MLSTPNAYSDAHVSAPQHGKVCKPYNSVLGEHFRAHWDVVPNPYDPADPDGEASYNDRFSESASIRSSKSTTSGTSSMFSKSKTSSTAATSLKQGTDPLAGAMGDLAIGSSTKDPKSARVVFLTEQVSHHPPVSAYYAACPDKSIEMFGIDQIAAKVSGTTVRVAPGEYNQGIFINLTGGPGEGERYHITHPVAAVNGILRGSFYVTIGDSTIITVEGGKPGHKFRTVIEYKEEVRC